MDPNTDKDQPTPSDLQASRWLLEQLPELTAKGVISPADAENLRTRYATQAAKSAHPSLVAFVCSLLGGLLVGCGIILIIAHNWNELGHPVRVALSFLPLIVGIGLSGYALRSSSKAWQEGAATFQVLAVGASISLVSQTYHIAGSTASFLLTWFFLALPVVYLLDSVGAAILCLNIAGMYASFAPKETLLNWTLFLAAAAQLYPLWKQGRSTSFRWLFWFSLYGLLFLLFAEATQAGHRIGYLAVGGFLGSCYLLSRHPFSGSPRLEASGWRGSPPRPSRRARSLAPFKPPGNFIGPMETPLPCRAFSSAWPFRRFSWRSPHSCCAPGTALKSSSPSFPSASGWPGSSPRGISRPYRCSS